ncbi:MBL fold metallo-hydrolase [Bosea sp. (in: a-proteobacteria)]|uniref:MBL fold metallo-hydrolase n=1 Tax=Bosea sp. (in: a-proteobacteria) TaxID=1871050 RepID=UPI00262E39D5|nr:MBL fold metallo-hydrolase [Bosea sp. (in: a-proteobacteria)]MCO5091838.1 MBL fold metallo-hydrolase [Bosea sp. (in: a-proteobacteria)]
MPVLPGISRIVAGNAGLMTYHGTNTYLLDRDDGFIVLDPGPEDESHVDAIVKATGGRVSAIVLSHTHADHVGAVKALKERTGAPTFGFHISDKPIFSPDIPLRDGDSVLGMTAIHTPGHASDHLCFALGDGTVFTADHIMSWASSVVSPPSGDMAAYVANLYRMLARGDRLYLPGHGPPLADPKPYVEDLIAHRVNREKAILQTLREGPSSAWSLMDRLYSKTHPWLRQAAERNVIAHLLKLRSEGLVRDDGDCWRAE